MLVISKFPKSYQSFYDENQESLIFLYQMLNIRKLFQTFYIGLKLPMIHFFKSRGSEIHINHNTINENSRPKVK